MHTPWGPSQLIEHLGDGVLHVSTASHGGIHLDATRQTLIPPPFRTVNGWYEQDCEWSFVAITFPDLFGELQVRYAHVVAAHWYPGRYRQVHGEQALQQAKASQQQVCDDLDTARDAATG